MTEKTDVDRNSGSPACSLPSPWDFACGWYQPDEIYRAINRLREPLTGDRSKQIPEDVTSREFAEWLTHQYRLAMNKGIEIGQRRAAGFPE